MTFSLRVFETGVLVASDDDDEVCNEEELNWIAACSDILD